MQIDVACNCGKTTRLQFFRRVVKRESWKRTWQAMPGHGEDNTAGVAPTCAALKEVLVEECPDCEVIP